MYTDTKANVLSREGETELFDILARVLQGDTLVPYLIIALDYALRKDLNGMKDELGFHLYKKKKQKNRV